MSSTLKTNIIMVMVYYKTTFEYDSVIELPGVQLMWLNFKPNGIDSIYLCRPFIIIIVSKIAEKGVTEP